MARHTVLVAGSSGVVGQAAVEAFVAAGWDVVAVSRRAPDLPASVNWRHVALDLLDVKACEAAVRTMSGVTHVVYAALYEKPELVATALQSTNDTKPLQRGIDPGPITGAGLNRGVLLDLGVVLGLGRLVKLFSERKRHT